MSPPSPCFASLQRSVKFLKNEDLTLNEANEALPNSSGVPPGLQAKALGSQLCSNDGILEIRLWEKSRI